jgi:hypothetical protein
MKEEHVSQLKVSEDGKYPEIQKAQLLILLQFKQFYMATEQLMQD